ncbi:malate synthase [Geosmithia morbida]|uniref:Malate synthase n=1 Tax=Geosmithia morbida TaxID=1094350 RepID=A0A9P4YZ87_9HYPO|nr:malate synthase [Geosmithia morbida]KAF4124765.1 malate synthase [Geosmithia morbida]
MIPIKNVITNVATADSILQGPNDSNNNILTTYAPAFLALLHRTFDTACNALLKSCRLRQAELDRGVLLDLLPRTKHIRDNDA